MRAAEIAAVLVCIRIEAQMMFSHAAVTAEGAACLDLRPPQRSGVEDKPTPSGRFHDRDFVILSDGQTGSPPSGGALLRENDRLDRPHLQRRIAHAFCHDDLSRGADIGKVINRLHVVHEDGVIAPREALHQLRHLHACPNLLGKGEAVITAAVVCKLEGVLISVLILLYFAICGVATM